MTPEQFKQWWCRHESHFPRLSEWFREMGEDKARGVRDVWKRQLITLEYLDACAASELLYDEGGIAYGDHPRAIRSIVNRSKSHDRKDREAEYLHGERVFDCPFCDDQGLVTVIRRGSQPVSMLCRCKHGDQRLDNWHNAQKSRRARQPMVRFDKSRYTLYEDHVESLPLPEGWESWRPAKQLAEGFRDD